MLVSQGRGLRSVYVAYFFSVQFRNAAHILCALVWLWVKLRAGDAASLRAETPRMVRVAPGSRPPSWSQNEIKVLVDAESSLYSSSVETPGPGEKMFSDPGLALS